MSLEQTKTPRLEEVYALYAGRMPALPALPPKDAWTVPPGLSGELEGVLGRTGVLQAGIIPREAFLRESRQTGGMHEKQEIMPCSTSPGCEWHISEEMPVVPAAKAQRVIRFKLLRHGTPPDPPKQIFDFCLTYLPENERWEISHRLIEPAQRGKGLLRSVVQAALDHLMEKRLNGLKRAGQQPRPQELSIDTGQPDVVLAFLQAGYVPADAEQATRVAKMLGGDATLLLAEAYGYVQDDQDHPVSRGTGRLYCYERATLDAVNDPLALTKNNAYRVRLVKRFGEMAAVQAVTEGQKARINKLLGH